jgi:RNA polymerase sigma factor (sigma-70 family)
MAGSQLKDVVRRLRGLSLAEAAEATPDAELLRRFVRQKDEGAFAALVRRHGPLVLGVCRRVLRNHADAEDAFQATFLVLARKAAAIRQPDALGSWLHGVACRTARQARRADVRRRTKEGKVIPRTETAPEEPDDWVGVLDEELAGLPERYRAALVLCDLQGQPRREAAQSLRCAEGTVASRLARGRDLLARRLTRRGFTFPAGALAVAFGEAAVPAPLVSATVQAAGGSAAAAVVALAERTLKIMLLTRLKGGTALLAVGVLVIATGVGVLGAPGGSVTPAPRQPRPAEEAAGDPVPQPRQPRLEGAKTSDAEFIRKACLDIRGSLPSDIEVHYFLRDKNPQKRAWLVGKLKEEAARAGKAAKPGEEAGPLEGTWEAVAYEQNGKRMGEEEVQKLRVAFRGDRMSVYRGEQLLGVHAFWLQPTKRPAVLLLKPTKGPEAGRTYEAIYELRGGRLKVCIGSTPGGPPPAEFRTQGGSGAALIELRRVPGPGR